MVPFVVAASKMGSFGKLAGFKIFVRRDSKSVLVDALLLRRLVPVELSFSHVEQPLTVGKSKRAWALRSVADNNRLNSSPNNDSMGRTRLIKAIQAVQFKITTRLKELRKNLPVKLFSFLAGFYCATAFATVIGQTGDWDVLSAAVAVSVVEGIGALMYKVSLPVQDNTKNLIAVFNYWKAGLTLGLFLDSFKY